MTVSDAHGGTTTVTVTPTIAPSNSAPIAGTPTSTTNAATGVVTGNVNATDPEKDALICTAATITTSKGSVSVTAAGAFTYTPTATARHAAANTGATTASTSDSFTVTVTEKIRRHIDDPGRRHISPANAAPVARTTVGAPNSTTGVVTGTVTATDADKDTLTYTVSTAPTKGIVAVTAAGGFTYTPTSSARQSATANTTDAFTALSPTATAAPYRSIAQVGVDPGTPIAGTPTVGTPNTSTGGAAVPCSPTPPDAP